MARELRDRLDVSVAFGLVHVYYQSASGAGGFQMTLEAAKVLRKKLGVAIDALDARR